jgi:hypothetical protein
MPLDLTVPTLKPIFQEIMLHLKPNVPKRLLEGRLLPVLQHVVEVPRVTRHLASDDIQLQDSSVVDDIPQQPAERQMVLVEYLRRIRITIIIRTSTEQTQLTHITILRLG